MMLEIHRYLLDNQIRARNAGNDPTIVEMSPNPIIEATKTASVHSNGNYRYINS